MDKRIENGIINVKERRTQMTENNIHILESVKDILTIANTDLITVQMGADYYEVGLEAINSLIKNNRDELIENGLKIYKKKDFLKVLEGHLRNNKQMNGKSILTFNDGYELIFPNRGMYLMTKRTLLNIGMLLRDSEIAKELRKRILDIVHDAENGNGNIDTISNEIDEETRLKVDYVDAMMSGDLVKMNEINAKLFELKNKRILELEKESKHKSGVIEGLAENITLAEKRQRLNQIIRINGIDKVTDRWNLLYSEFEKKYHLDLSKRMSNLVYKGKIINNLGEEIKVTKKIKENKLEYIDKVLNQLNELYELSVKLFEIDLDKLLDNIKNVVK
jgi:hypothetical protein